MGVPLGLRVLQEVLLVWTRDTTQLAEHWLVSRFRLLFQFLLLAARATRELLATHHGWLSSGEDCQKYGHLPLPHAVKFKAVVWHGG